MPPKRGRNNNNNNKNGKTDSNEDQQGRTRGDQPKIERGEINNALFEEYYKDNIVSGDQWDQMTTVMREQLPISFRVSNITGPKKQILGVLKNDCFGLPSTPTVFKGDDGIEATLSKPEVLPWYRPQGNAFQIDLGRRELKRFPAIEQFRKFLILHNHVGNITRQEAVSMIPPLLLDVKPHHVVLDMCAAPGSKTSQLLEQLHTGLTPGEIPSGIVIANDANEERAYMLVHQLKRLGSPSFMVTTHEGQTFPSLLVPKDSTIASADAGFREGLAHTHQEKSGNYFTTAHVPQIDEITGQPLQTPLAPLLFDRILCDVPCGGDGTMRKTPTVWAQWNLGNSFALQPLQIIIAWRALQLLKIGGMMVYSTCSINPIEDEAVVNELIRRSKGTLELVRIQSILPELQCQAGKKEWIDYVDVPKTSHANPTRIQKITCLQDILDLPPQVQRRLRASNFSPALLAKLYPEAQEYVKSCVAKWEAHVAEMKAKFPTLEDALKHQEDERAEQQRQRDIRDAELKEKVLAEGKEWKDNFKANKANKANNNNNKSKKDSSVVSSFLRDLLRMKHLNGCENIENAVRVLPHQQNTGGFFIALIRKVGQLPSYDESLLPLPYVYTMRYDIIKDVYSYQPEEHNAVPVGADLAEASQIRANLMNKQRAEAAAVAKAAETEAAGDEDDLIVAATKAAEAIEGGGNKSQNQHATWTKDPFKISPEKVSECLKTVWGVEKPVQLLTRHAAKQYLMSKSIQEIILCPQNYRLKVVHGGLKAFESDAFLGNIYNNDDVSSSQKLNHPTDAYFRACQDAAQYTFPLVAKQTISVPKDDMIKILTNTQSLSINDLSQATKDILLNKSNKDNEDQDVSKVIRGGSVLISYIDPETDTVIVVAGLKRAYSLSLLVEPVERDAYKYILGVHDDQTATTNTTTTTNSVEPIQGDADELVQLAQ